MILLNMAIKLFKSKVIEVKSPSSNIKCLKLSKPKNFEFKPGQYLLLNFYLEGKKFKNPYSITSIPDKEFIEFCIKLVENGKSFNFIKNLKKGDNVELFGPAGRFVINKDSEEKDLIFISTGTGIAPFMSMISSLLEKNFKNKIILFKGFRNEDESLYEEEFSHLQKKYKNFRFYNILSQPKNKKFRDKGYVQDFLDKYIPINFDGDFYICGLSGMVEDVLKNLKNKDIRDNRISFEKYN